jgi:3-hydroxyisobutyrate dehydrogenase-like beta-hydroxyacid dehydrogenase
MTDRTDAPVTVIGLGPMGRAMARALMDGGHPVTVWNRTPSRADELVAGGATRTPTPADAVAAADLVVLSLTDYQAMYDILDPPTGLAVNLTGKVVVNLSSDTPQRTRDAAVWARDRGAGFLTGGAMVPAPMIGTADAYVYYSGRREILEAHEPALRLIGAPRYVGEDPGLAALLPGTTPWVSHRPGRRVARHRPHRLGGCPSRRVPPGGDRDAGRHRRPARRQRRGRPPDRRAVVPW